jgi:hypothetical protein
MSKQHLRKLPCTFCDENIEATDYFVCRKQSCGAVSSVCRACWPNTVPHDCNVVERLLGSLTRDISFKIMILRSESPKTIYVALRSTPCPSGGFPYLSLDLRGSQCISALPAIEKLSELMG